MGRHNNFSMRRTFPFFVSMSKLVDSARTEALATVPQWKEVDNRDAITRTFMFKSMQLVGSCVCVNNTPFVDFKDAFAFMTKTAEYCDPVCYVFRGYVKF